MVKNGFSSLIRGIFYTIGKMIAFILIGLLIGFLAVKFNVPIKNLVMLEAHAQENLSGAWTFYDKSTFHSVLPSGYDSTISGISYPSSTYTQISAANLSEGTYHVGTALDIQANHNFVSGTYYTLKYHFDFGSYIYPLWPNNNSQSWFFGYCPGSNCTLSYQWQGDSSHQSTSYLDLTINFRATSNSNSVYFTIGNFSDSLGTFYNAYTSQQGIRISSATIDSSSSSDSNQNIIDNDNQNTQNIMNNINQNTQDVINQINENNDKLTESQKVCSFIDKNNVVTNGYLDSSGTLHIGQDIGVTDFINVESSTLTLLETQSSIGAYLCFYNTNKSLISCVATRDFSANSSITIPNNSSYIKATIVTTLNKPTFKLCKNGNQALSDDINDLNNTLKDDNLPDVINSGGGGGTYFDDINQSSDTPISDLLLLPLNLLNKVNENLSSSCSPYTIPFDFTGGSNTLTFPCINIESYVGSELWGIIDAMFSLFMIYNIFRLIIRYYDSWTSLDDTFHSLIKGGTN